VGYTEKLIPQPATKRFFEDPASLLGTRILVVKSTSQREKGALIIDYSFVFSLFASRFDIQRIAERYHIILEPSWSGSCDRDLLAFAGYEFPVFVQDSEPRDIDYISRLGLNLIPVPIAANWWVDGRVFRPLPEVTRDADVMVNAAWARFKRHDSLFAALAKIRRRGRRLRTLLVGYAVDLTKKDILSLAMRHNISDQIELYEGLTPIEVNAQLNRVKATILWSRREGFNRAIIEGFYAGVPGILYKAHNYGYQYPYINAITGCFADEKTLERTLIELVDDNSRFQTRNWVTQHMSPEHATAAIDQAIANYSATMGDPWTCGHLALKVSSLGSMVYCRADATEAFASDYDFLRRSRRPSA
jgi:glycosyltransferase involved in cell wall biosynthesis